MGLMTPCERKEGEEDRRGCTEAETRTHRGVWAMITVISSKCHQMMTSTMRWISIWRRRGIGAQVRGAEFAGGGGWWHHHMSGGERTCWVRGRPVEIRGPVHVTTGYTRVSAVAFWCDWPVSMGNSYKQDTV